MSDQATLCDLQQIVRATPYEYLEIGSYLGDSLIPCLRDDMCTTVYSVDPRPLSTPDERGISFDYHATTERMVENIRAKVPSLDRLLTFDMDAKEFARIRPEASPSLVFIDAEHTNVGVVRDFLSINRLLPPDSIVAFHDSNFVFDGLLNIEQFLYSQYTDVCFCFLPDNVGVFGFGKYAGELSRLQWHNRDDYLKRVRKELNAEIARNHLHPPNGAFWGPIEVH